MATRKVTIQDVEHVQLRIMVEVSWDKRDEQWLVRWLDQSTRHLTRAGAVAAARSQCKQLTSCGILSELVLRGKAGTIMDRRTYGMDPRRRRG